MSADDTITVVLAADANYRMQLATTFATLAASHAGEAFRAVVLHDAFAESDRRAIEQSLDASTEVLWIDAGSAELRDLKVPPRLGTASLFRLRIPELLPSDIDRFIFLDCDLVVRRSLRDLWNEEVGDAGVAAVHDAAGPWAASQWGARWVDVSDRPDAPYFNAGVMLSHRSYWQETQLGLLAIDSVRRHHVPNADQCALNIVLAGGWKSIAPAWNVQAAHLAPEPGLAWVVEPVDELRAALADPSVVHFTHSGFGKPWQSNCRHPYRDEWLDALDRTAWSGWRPRRPSAAARAKYRLRSARRALFGRAAARPNGK